MKTPIPSVQLERDPAATMPMDRAYTGITAGTRLDRDPALDRTYTGTRDINTVRHDRDTPVGAWICRPYGDHVVRAVCQSHDGVITVDFRIEHINSGLGVHPIDSYRDDDEAAWLRKGAKAVFDYCMKTGYR